MTSLRSLELDGRSSPPDLELFASLEQLEHLGIAVSPACENCVPLRRLRRLRSLNIEKGFVCDLVGYLPRLETLVWDNRVSTPHYLIRDRATLYQRQIGRPPLRTEGQEGGGRLKRLVLRGQLAIDPRDASVREMLAGVEEVELLYTHDGFETFEAISRLCHLKRLALVRCGMPWVQHLRDRRYMFACADTLEELFVFLHGLYEMPPALPLPLWFHDRLPNLRVLASPFPESMATLACLCPRLTHVHLPFSPRADFWWTPRSRLRQLCVVTLALQHDCTWLRLARRPGGPLPSLRQIFHPTHDCLSSPTRCERYRWPEGYGYAIGNDKGFVANSILRPAWRHKWEHSDK